jgi:hypothetical protein
MIKNSDQKIIGIASGKGVSNINYIKRQVKK